MVLFRIIRKKVATINPLFYRRTYLGVLRRKMFF